MTALARLIERFFGTISDGDMQTKMGARIVRGLMLAILLSVSAGIVYLRVNYNLSLGPK